MPAVMRWMTEMLDKSPSLRMTLFAGIVMAAQAVIPSCASRDAQQVAAKAARQALQAASLAAGAARDAASKAEKIEGNQESILAMLEEQTL